MFRQLDRSPPDFIGHHSERHGPVYRVYKRSRSRLSESKSIRLRELSVDPQEGFYQDTDLGCKKLRELREWRASVREVIKYLRGAINKILSSLMEKGEPYRATTISAAVHRSGQTESHSSLTWQLVGSVSESHLIDSQTMQNQILWSDDTKMKLLFCSSPQSKPGGGSIMRGFV